MRIDKKFAILVTKTLQVYIEIKLRLTDIIVWIATNPTKEQVTDSDCGIDLWRPAWMDSTIMK